MVWSKQSLESGSNKKYFLYNSFEWSFVELSSFDSKDSWLTCVPTYLSNILVTGKYLWWMMVVNCILSLSQFYIESFVSTDSFFIISII